MRRGCLSRYWPCVVCSGGLLSTWTIRPLLTRIDGCILSSDAKVVVHTTLTRTATGHSTRTLLYKAVAHPRLRGSGQPRRAARYSALWPRARPRVARALARRRSGFSADYSAPTGVPAHRLGAPPRPVAFCRLAIIRRSSLRRPFGVACRGSAALTARCRVRARRLARFCRRAHAARASRGARARRARSTLAR